MRIIAEGTIRQWAGDHARAAASLRQWVKVVRPIRWRSFIEKTNYENSLANH